MQELGDALGRAEAAGFERGYAQARDELGGEDAAFLVANALADAMEAAAGRLAGRDANFSERLHKHAATLRRSVHPPKLAAFAPADGADDVAEDAPVSATFDVDMDETSLSLETFAVAGASGGPPLSAELVYDAGSRTATLTPANGFTSGVQYRATLDGLASSEGRALPGPVTWVFTAA